MVTEERNQPTRFGVASGKDFGLCGLLSYVGIGPGAEARRLSVYSTTLWLLKSTMEDSGRPVVGFTSRILRIITMMTGASFGWIGQAFRLNIKDVMIRRWGSYERRMRGDKIRRGSASSGEYSETTRCRFYIDPANGPPFILRVRCPMANIRCCPQRWQTSLNTGEGRFHIAARALFTPKKCPAVVVAPLRAGGLVSVAEGKGIVAAVAKRAQALSVIQPVRPKTTPMSVNDEIRPWLIKTDEEATWQRKNPGNMCTRSM